MEPTKQERDPNPTPKRLPYEKPLVISEEVFETLALSCASGSPLACPGGNPDKS